MDTENQEMQEQNRRLRFANPLRMWQVMDLNSKILLSAVGILLLTGIGFLISMTAQPTYSLLYGGLDLKDSSSIIQELDGQNISYKLKAGGRDVYVPSKFRDMARIQLAGKGLPATTVGYELFDKNQMTLSSFQQKNNYIRAMEGELARTLMTVEYIEFANVKLKMPDPTPFLEEQEEPSASVVLKLSGPASLNPSKVGVVAHLIASAIGADPKNITITDDKLNLISGGGTDDFNAQPLPNQFSYRKNLEDSLRQKIKSVLEPAYGMGNITVAVSADLDFDKVDEQSITYEPMQGSDSGVLRSSDSTEKSSENTPLADGGIAGASANIPSYLGSETSASEKSKTKESSETRNYEVSQTTKSTNYATGTVKKLSVSVLLNAEKLEAAEKTDIENLVRSALNLDTARGDLITVAAQVFDETFQKEMEAARTKLSSSERNKTIVTFVLLGLVIGLALYLLKRIMQPVKVPMPRIQSPSATQSTTIETEVEPIELMQADPKSQARARLREEVVSITSKNPEQAAKVIKSWLKE
jgi:flagellar M-ring protein FliF